MSAKTVVIHQPDFLPYLGFFHRLLHADLYVALDTAQFVRGTSRSWTHRDKIKTRAGECWITLGTARMPLGTPIREVALAPQPDWRRRNLAQIRESYARARHFGEIYPRLERLYASHAGMLAEFNLESIDLASALLDISVPVTLASSLDPAGRSNEMLVDILTKVGATGYLSGPGARAYYDPAPFARAGIKVNWQRFDHPVYPQLHGAFIPYLSCIDLLMNCGADESRRILRSV